MADKKGDDHLDEIRTVLRRPASGRADDTTFHHDDHAQTKKPEASSGRRPKKDPDAENRSTIEILHAAGQRALSEGLPGAAAMFVQVPKR